MASTTLNYSIPYPQNTDAVDIAGDIQNIAEHLDQNLNEIISDTVGLMVQSNSENGISVIYNDSDNTLDFITNNFNIVLSGDVSGSATVSSLSNANINVSINDDSHSHSALTINDLLMENISDTDIVLPLNGETIVYEGATEKWVNSIPSKTLFVVEQSSTFVLSPSDSGKTIEMNNSASANILIPTSASTTFEDNSVFYFVRLGTGDVYFSTEIGASPSVTINSLNGNRKISGRYGEAKLYMYDMNTWVLTGDLS